LNRKGDTIFEKAQVDTAMLVDEFKKLLNKECKDI